MFFTESIDIVKSEVEPIMLKSIKVSFKDTIIYGLGNVSVKFVGLLLINLYTNPKFFTVDDFGRIGFLKYLQ